MREWLSGGVSPCQGEGRGFESRLVLFLLSFYKSPDDLFHSIKRSYVRNDGIMYARMLSFLHNKKNCIDMQFFCYHF